MELLKMLQEACGQDADLPARQRDAMLFLEAVANLLPLAVVHETLHSDPDFDIVAIHSAGWHLPGQGLGTPRRILSGRVLARGRTDPYGLSGDERSMTESNDALPHDRLLDSGDPGAQRARFDFRFHRHLDAGAGQSPGPLAFLELQPTHFIPFGRERLEGRFFLPSWCSVKTVSTWARSTPRRRSRAASSAGLSWG